MTDPPPLKTTAAAVGPEPGVAHDSWTGLELLGRYLVGPKIGSGGFGVVYRAGDTALGTSVAVKVLHSARPGGLERIERIEREILALRHLNLPGIVRFLDSGIHEETPFFVMELVDGAPFPGPASTALPSWEELEPVVVALVEALARLHRRGYVHRDLKPGNVLVDARGVPTILDFGLVWGPELGERLTQTGRFVGTPAYLAPEQLGGSVVERRADLFSLGVMIYEALSGRLPFPGLDLLEIALHKANTLPETLHRINDEIPRRISDLVARLLATNPVARPEDAAEVLGVIRGERQIRDTLPWIDHSGLEARFLRALDEGVSFDLFGGPGSGRTRALDEFARIAAERGVETRHTVAADGPFASLETVLASESLERAAKNLSFEQMAVEVEARLARVLAKGIVLLVDDVGRLDRWSAPLIERARDRGIVVRATPEKAEGAHVLEPFKSTELRGLFRGYDRVFHIREDAAEQLFLRTDGIPDLVFEELAAWERAGICERSDGLWSIERTKIDELSVGFETAASLRVSRLRETLTRDQEDLLAWIDLAFPHARVEALASWTGQELWRVEAQLVELLERNLVRVSEHGTYGALVTGLAVQIWTRDQLRAAHRSLAAHIQHGSANRLYHLIEAQSGDQALADEAAKEVVACGERLFEEGRFGEAIAALSNGWKFVRTLGLPQEELGILELWARTALSASAVPPLEALRRELAGIPDPDTRVSLLDRHLEAWIEALTGGGEKVIETLLRLPGYPEERLDRGRIPAMVMASRPLSLEREGEVLDSLEDMVSAESRGWFGNLSVDWRARYLYRCGKFAQSAALIRSALKNQVSREVSRATSWINAAYAHSEIGEWADGREALTLALEALGKRRVPPLELRCLGLARKFSYCEDKVLQADLELTQIAALLKSPAIHGPILLGEAAIAWRSGDRQLAGVLARQVAEGWDHQGRREPAALAWALAKNCGAVVDPEPASLMETAVGAEAPGLWAQILALLALSGVRVDSLVLREFCTAFPEGQRGYRREVLSISECMDALDDGSG